MAHFQSEGLETGGEEDLSTIQACWGVAFPHEVSEVGKDPLSWAAAFENGEDGGGDVVSTLFVSDFLHAVCVNQQVLPVCINGHLSLEAEAERRSKSQRQHNDHRPPT